jgi:hypothetical protein
MAYIEQQLGVFLILPWFPREIVPFFLELRLSISFLF